MRLAFFLWAAVVVSALLQVMVSHQQRQILQQWQKQEALKLSLQRENSRLILERSTMGAPSRLDSVARNKLNMIEPAKIQVLHQ